MTALGTAAADLATLRWGIIGTIAGTITSRFVADLVLLPGVEVTDRPDLSVGPMGPAPGPDPSSG